MSDKAPAIVRPPPPPFYNRACCRDAGHLLPWTYPSLLSLKGDSEPAAIFHAGGSGGDAGSRGKGHEAGKGSSDGMVVLGRVRAWVVGEEKMRRQRAKRASKKVISRMRFAQLGAATSGPEDVRGYWGWAPGAWGA